MSSGIIAEQIAVTYLEDKGYEIIDQNWRNKWCEIDIVAKLDSTVYFVEVKYRQSEEHGSGLDYINRAKLKQMAFAAKLWVQQNNFEEDYELSAIELTGPEFKISQHIEQIT